MPLAGSNPPRKAQQFDREEAEERAFRMLSEGKKTAENRLGVRVHTELVCGRWQPAGIGVVASSWVKKAGGVRVDLSVLRSMRATMVAVARFSRDVDAP